MIKPIVDQWELNKNKLREEFEKLEDQSSLSYPLIMQMILDHVLVYPPSTYTPDRLDKTAEWSAITEICDGSFHGTQIFHWHKKGYSPDLSDYFYTDNEYGSCSGCDTLQGIFGYWDEKPTPNQIDQLMQLALNLVQSIQCFDQTAYIHMENNL